MREASDARNSSALAVSMPSEPQIALGHGALVEPAESHRMKSSAASVSSSRESVHSAISGTLNSAALLAA